MLCHCWLGGTEGIRPVKKWGDGGGAPSRMVGVFASVNLSLHHKVQKFSSGTGSRGWSWKKGHKTVVMVVVLQSHDILCQAFALKDTVLQC